MLKVVKYLLLLMFAASLLLLEVAEYQGEQSRLRNQPLWSSLSAEGSFRIDDSLTLQGTGRDLVLQRTGGQPPQTLFTNYRSAFRSLAMYRKDLDRDGEDELVFLADDDEAGDLYIFSNLHGREVTRSVTPDLLWTAHQLRFSAEGEMYIRSCGSSYCEDTFYGWRDGRLVEGRVDSFESW